MSNVQGFIASIFSGNLSDWIQTLVVAVMAYYVYPLVKAKRNDERKIELDASAGLRGDLFTRIRELEAARDGEPLRIDAAIAIERRRCDAEMADMKLDYNRRIDGLERVIAQNSQSQAQVLGWNDGKEKGQ